MSPVRRRRAPTGRQTTITSYFPVRRSSRECKTALKVGILNDAHLETVCVCLLFQNKAQEELERKIVTETEAGLRVVDVVDKGRGVVTVCPFSKGEFLCEYSGELITEKEAKEREQEYSEDATVGCYVYYFSHKSSRWWYVLVLTIRVHVINSSLAWSRCYFGVQLGGMFRSKQ